MEIEPADFKNTKLSLNEELFLLALATVVLELFEKFELWNNGDISDSHVRTDCSTTILETLEEESSDAAATSNTIAETMKAIRYFTIVFIQSGVKNSKISQFLTIFSTIVDQKSKFLLSFNLTVLI